MIQAGVQFFRKTVSRVANYLFRLSLDSGVRDATSGYRCYSRRAAQYLLENTPRNGSYAGQVEIVEELHRAGMKIVKYGIKFRRRISGKSKLTAGNILGVLLLFAYKRQPMEVLACWPLRDSSK